MKGFEMNTVRNLFYPSFLIVIDVNDTSALNKQL